MSSTEDIRPVDGAALIRIAAQYLNPQELDSRVSGAVAAVIVSPDGDQFFGVSIDVPSSMGFCAEAGAIGAMITARETRIAQVVAVTRGHHGAMEVLPPCGRCREFMYQIDHRNVDAQVMVAVDRAETLDSLLPARWN